MLITAAGVSTPCRLNKTQQSNLLVLLTTCNHVLQMTPDNATRAIDDDDGSRLNAAGPQHTTPNVGVRPAWPALLLWSYGAFYLFCYTSLTCNIPQTRTTLRHTIGKPEHISKCTKAVCPPCADLGVVSLHRDMVQRDNDRDNMIETGQQRMP